MAVEGMLIEKRPYLTYKSPRVSGDFTCIRCLSTFWRGHELLGWVDLRIER